MHKVRGVVAWSAGAPVSIETIVVPDPGPGEAVVAVQACGVCHTDLHYREGGINDDFPFLLGHEAAGVVEAVGPDVTACARRLRRSSTGGRCAASAGLPPRSAAVLLRHAQRHAEDDAGRRHAAVARPGHRRVRREDARGRRPVHAGRSRGAARRRRAARLRRDGRARRGDAHRQRGARATRWRCSAAAASATPRSPAPCSPARATIIAVDLDDREARVGQDVRRDAHRQRVDDDPVEAVRAVDRRLRRRRVHRGRRPSRGAASRRSTPATSRAPWCRSACRRPDMRFPDIPMIEFFGRGGALKPSWYGDCLPSRDFPMLDRSLPAGPARPRPLRVRDDRASTASKRRSTGWSAARSSAPSCVFD